MGSGGKSNVLGAQIDWNDTGDFLADQFTNSIGGSLVGYDAKTGKLKEGMLTHALDEGFGEISGRNLARHDMAVQAENLDKEAAARAQDLANKQLLDFRSDVNASSAAAAARATADARGTATGSTKTASSATGQTLGDEKDLLGL